MEHENKITDLANKVAEISEKVYDFLLARTNFTGNDDYQHFPAFTPMLSLIILDINKKVTN